jgi:hypothetical protein
MSFPNLSRIEFWSVTAFQPKVKQCNQVETFRFQAPHSTPKPKVELIPHEPKMDILVASINKFFVTYATINSKRRKQNVVRKKHIRNEPIDFLLPQKAGGKAPDKVGAMSKITPKRLVWLHNCNLDDRIPNVTS